MTKRSTRWGWLPPSTKDRLARLAERNRLAYAFKVRRLARRTDVFIVSFPKTGRTWLRVMLGRALQQHFGLKGRKLLRYTAADVHHPGLPRVLATHDDSPQAKRAEEIIADKRPYRRSRVVFMVRDPRDVIVSLYHHRSSWYRGTQSGYQGTLGAFLEEEIGSFDSLLRFYQVWEAARDVPRDFLLVRYEDLHTNPSVELRRVLEFVGVPNVPDALIDDAIRFAAFDNMRRLERRDTLKTKALRIHDAADPNARRVRRGLVGGYTQELTAEQVRDLDRRLAAATGVFDYTP